MVYFMEEPIQKDDFGVPGVPPIFGKKPIGDRKSMKILKMFTVLSFYMSFFSGKYGHTMDPWTIHREVTMDTTFFTITSHHLSPDPKERAEDPTVSHQRRSKSAVDVASFQSSYSWHTCNVRPPR